MNNADETGAYQSGDAPAAADASPALPKQVGRYRIERVLGKGGFGIVYLAHDDQLQRLVAVKVPHASLVAQTPDAEAYLTEARTVANLDHPHIVPVFDVGSTPDCPCFVVSKYIDGADLSARLRHSRFPLSEAVELAATVAETLNHAHKQGLVHRDIKPGNILLDKCGKPFVGDFGLALREQDAGKGRRYTGTPAYMSPEQARGEGHRVDGRSDVFSLGVVLYELLAGHRPFRADSQAELMEQVASHEPRPLRQLDEGIPKELERVCFKALSKRASERYMTAKDMADDLRHFLTGQTGTQQSGSDARVTASRPATAVVQPPWASIASGRSSATPPATPMSDQPLVKIVPKGLRSFDGHDADFFLELLPGPRDRDGLPDSIRFWKTRIEEVDAENTFAVGLIYGPSGCGKSSLVKAGLLPRLSGDVIAVYLEATSGETEARLLNGLRKKCPALPADLGVKESMAVLRRGQGIPVGKKVLIVIDQFEQWLHAKKEEENADLVQALRQCDGGRVQCVVMVRDDFWMAATRFMRELEVRLLEGHNSAAVDLFDTDHARKVVAAFGRAFGKLPENASETDKEQKEFLKQSVSGLAQEGKVVSVRLALFAEMMKGKAWTPASLKAVGGTEGVGITFLEETFSAATSPPEHRYHQKAARAVLRVLLPETGSDIKGHMRSYAELLEVSGYGNRPKDSDELLRILDNEIRLITPTDPDGKEVGGGPVVQARPGQKYYQLTHDYLVRSIREWLTRKQKETRRGRAELLLADRAAVWNARPENRQLPSLVQWFQIRWPTAKKNWTPPQAKMMRQASRHHAIRGVGVAVVLASLSWGGWEGHGRLEGRRLRDRLLGATTADAPGIVKEMAPYRRWADPLVKDAYAQAEKMADPRKQLHASLALLPGDDGQAAYLYERLLTGTPQEIVVIREALDGHRNNVTEQLWAVLENQQSDQGRRLRAACALAAFTPDDQRWGRVAGDVAVVVVNQQLFELSAWTDALKGAGRWFVDPLAEFLVDERRSISQRGLMASVYRVFAADVPDAIVRLESQLSATSADDATVEDSIRLARRQASVGAALLVMGRGEMTWPLLKMRSDPTTRSYLIERLPLAGVDPKILVARLGDEKDVSVRKAILLILGEFSFDRMSMADRQSQLPHILELFRNDPDSGVHGAAEWVLRQWQASEQISVVDNHFATGKVEGKREWYCTREGQTMVLVPKSDAFWVGENDGRHRRRIDQNFAIASKEITASQFLRFRDRHDFNKWYSPKGDCPIHSVSWYDAAAYCNWLNQLDGVPKNQWCYLPNKDGRYAEGMSIAPDYCKRTGYRLPTETEWEYACRAGATTTYSFGLSVELLGKYAWFDGTALGTSRPVGTTMPNHYGLFDMHGNVWEWCQDIYEEYATTPEADPDVGRPLVRPIRKADQFVLRGASYNNPPTHSRSANRTNFEPATLDNAVGFRLARTVVP